MVKVMNKRRKKRIKRGTKLVLMIGVLLAIFWAFRVKAGLSDSKLVREKIEGVYAVVELDDGKHLYDLEIYKMNEKTVYCLELGVKITTDIYNSSEDIGAFGYGVDDIRYINLLSYYGYGYEGHSDYRYYMATQELIWEYLGKRDVWWTKELSVIGDAMDIEVYKEEILSLIDKEVLCDLEMDLVEDYMGSKITIYDKNRVLSKYEVVFDGGHLVTISDDKIEIVLNEDYVGESEIVIRRVDDLDGEGMIYYYDNSQELFLGGSLDSFSEVIKVKSLGYNLTIKRANFGTFDTVEIGEAKISGAKYRLLDETGKVIEEFEMGESCEHRVSGLTKGFYTLEELSPSVGYKKGKTINFGVFREESLTYHLVEMIRNDIELFKVYGEGDKVYAEEGVVFEVYDYQGKFYDRVVTDEAGIGLINLPYGHYRFRQVNGIEGYEKVADFSYFVQEEKEEVMRYNLVDEAIKYGLVIDMVDLESGLVIKDSFLKFKVKKENGYLGYVNKEGIYTEEFLIGGSGVLETLIDISYGTYEIEIVLGDDDYVTNEKKYLLEVGDSSRFYINEEGKVCLKYDINLEPRKRKIVVNKVGEVFKRDGDGSYFDNISLEKVELELWAGSDIVTKDGIVHYEKGERVDTLVTDSDGKVVFKDLYKGNYCVKETKTVTGYLLDKEEYCLELDTDEYDIEIVNKLMKGSLSVDFVFEEGEGKKEDLEGSKVFVYDGEGNLVGDFVVSGDGEFLVPNLPLGEYYVVLDNNGYQCEVVKKYFQIIENEEVVKVIFELGKKKFIKFPNTFSGRNYVVEVICVIILGLGILVVTFNNKK